MVAGNDSWQLMECQHGTANNAMPHTIWLQHTLAQDAHFCQYQWQELEFPWAAGVLGLQWYFFMVFLMVFLKVNFMVCENGLHARSIGDGPAGLMDALHHLGCNLLVQLWDILQGGTMGQVAGMPGQSTHLAAGQLVHPVAPPPAWTAWVFTIGVPPVAQPMVLGLHHPWRWASSWASPWHWASSWSSPWHWSSSWQPSWMAWLHTEGIGFAMALLGCLEQWMQLQHT